MLGLIATTLFTACQQDPPPATDSLAYIPKDAAMVTAIRTQQLMDKADFASLKAGKGYQEMLRKAREENAALARVLEDPKQAGIDLQQNAYVSVLMEGESPGMVVVSFSVADRAALEKLMEGLAMEARPVSNDFKMAGSSGDAIMAWNDNSLLLGVPMNKQDAEAELQRMMELKPDQSVASNPELRQELDADYDVLNWFSSDFILQSDNWKASGNLLNYSDEELQGQSVAHRLTFEDGAVESYWVPQLQGRIKNDLGMFFRDDVDTDFITKAPAGKPSFLLSAAFDINGVNQLLVEKYSKGMAESALSQFGVSATDLLKAFKGDMMLLSYAEQEMGNALFMASVEDAAALQEVITQAEAARKIEKISEGRYRFLEWEMEEERADTIYATETVKLDAQFLLRGGLLYLSNTPALLDQAEAGDTGLSGGIAEQAGEMLNQHIFTALGSPADFPNWDDFAGIENVEASATREGVRLRITLPEKGQNSLGYFLEGMLDSPEEETPAPDEAPADEL